MWASRSYARSPGTVCLGSGSCTSARTFAPRFFQTPPRDDALALRYDFTSIRLSKGLSPSSCRTCSAHKKRRPVSRPPFCTAVGLGLEHETHSQTQAASSLERVRHAVLLV